MYRSNWYDPLRVSSWLRSACCGAPIHLSRWEAAALDWVYCIGCSRRIGCVLEEDWYGLLV